MSYFKKSLVAVAVLATLCATVFSLVIFFGPPGTASASVKTEPYPQLKPDGPQRGKIFQWIGYESLNSKLAQIKNEDMLIDLYPVKNSGDLKSSDFDLIVCYRDLTGRELKGVKKVSMDDFKKRSANYVHYLRENHVPKSSVAWGYQIRLNRQLLTPNKNLLLDVDVLNGKMKFMADSCKVPPGCTFAKMQSASTTLAADSACKTPPGCKFVLINGEVVKGLIEKLYSEQVKE